MFELIKSVIKSGLGSISSILFGVLTSKLISSELGATGLGLFSIIKQAIISLSSLGTGTQVALVQFVASKDANHVKNGTLIIFYLFVIFAIAISLSAAVLTYYYSAELSTYTQLGSPAFYLIAVAAVIFNVYYFVRATLNGLRKIGTIASLDFISAFLALTFTIPAIQYFKDGEIEAFAVALIGSQLITLVIAIKLLRTSIRSLDIIHNSVPNFDFRTSFTFFKIAAPTLIATFVASGSIFILKANVNDVLTISHVGYFDAAWTISVSYVTLLLAAFGTYFLPALVVNIKQDNHKQLIDNVCRLCLAIAVPMIILLIVSKTLIISLLYSTEFYPSVELLQVMFIGDYLKIGAWIFAIPALALQDYRTYLKTELVFFLGLLSFSAVLMNHYSNLIAIGVVSTVLYAALFVFYYKYTKEKLKYTPSTDMKVKWVIGFLLIIIVSILFWDRQLFDLPSSILALCCGLLFSASMLKRAEWSALLKLTRN